MPNEITGKALVLSVELKAKQSAVTLNANKPKNIQQSNKFNQNLT